METAIWSVVGLASGALITFLVGRRYYVKAAVELRQEAEKLHDRVALVGSVLSVILHALSDAGMVHFERDERGTIRYDPDTGLPRVVTTKEVTHFRSDERTS